jgi:2-polyprenyl-3-methyl-5-hydroxy-6-metoxy-1,4-benzoquinol methylase
VYLIERCICGSAGPFEVLRGPIEIENLRCVCGVIFQLSTRTPEAIAREYEGHYHASTDRHPCLVPYAQRYDGDRSAARARIARYRKLLPELFCRDALRVLDVGCANGAFVDELLAAGVDAYGCDPDPVGGERERVRRGTLVDEAGRYDAITYHDVLEHLVYPQAELELARTKLEPGGCVVVDVPDATIRPGHKHFKAEHLWYFTADAVASLFKRVSLVPLVIDRPIPGKLVIYGKIG